MMKMVMTTMMIKQLMMMVNDDVLPLFCFPVLCTRVASLLLLPCFAHGLPPFCFSRARQTCCLS